LAEKNAFRFARMLANILLAASAVSLAYTVWMIYQNILETAGKPAMVQPAAQSLSHTRK